MQVPVLVMPHNKPVQLDLFEVVPDVQVHAKPVNVTVPRVGIMIWQPVAGGLFKPVLETHPPVVDLTRWNETVYGCSKLQIRALVEAGFVEGERIAPRRLKINLESYFLHRAKMRANPYFWQDDDNRRRYSQAVDALQRRESNCPPGREHRKRQRTETAPDAPFVLSAPPTPPERENVSPGLGERNQPKSTRRRPAAHRRAG